MSTSPTYDDVSRSLRKLAARSSPAQANRVLLAAAGTTSLKDIDPSIFGDVIEALDGAPDHPRENEMLDGDGEINVSNVYKFWNAAGKRD